MLPWWRDPTIWSAVFTFVIAAATVSYVVFTRRLWQETKKTADAAKQSAEASTRTAEAARNSAEIGILLHRPFIGLVRVDVRVLDANQPQQMFSWTLKNFGTLPAVNVHATAQLFIASQNWSDAATAATEIFPLQEVESILSFQLSAEACGRVNSGDWLPVLRVHVSYAAFGERQYHYTAEAHFKHPSTSFVVLSSETTP